MNNKKVSIIIPAYNVEEYIYRGIESCCNQTYSNLEIIIIDDGSTDKTWEVIQKYKNRDSRIIAYHQRNQGVSVARNHALKIMTGDYVLFLDSDDYLEINAVERLVNYVNEDNQMLISSNCFYANFDEKGNIVKEDQSIGTKEACLDREEIILYTNKIQYALRSACYKLFSVRVIRENNLIFDEKISHGEDGLFVFEYICVTDGFIYFPEPLWNILERPNSATTGGYNAKWLTAIDAIDKMEKHDGLSDATYAMLRTYKAERILMLTSTSMRCNPIDKKDVKFLKSLLKKNLKGYMSQKHTIKQNVYCISMAYMPVLILQMVFKLLKL